MSEPDKPALLVGGNFVELDAYKYDAGVFFFCTADDPHEINMITGAVFVKNTHGVDYNADKIAAGLFNHRLGVFGVRS